MAAVETVAGKIGFAGAAGARAIVFLHGVGSDKSVWRPQLAHFGPGAVAFDYPGYGESDFQPNATRDDFAAAILSAMDALGIGSAHICGLSLGGVVAVAMHALAPERCSSLILADTFAVHPDGRAIYERSVAASEDLRALAEARVDSLLAPGTLADVRTEVVETMARIDPAAYRVGAEAVWLADQQDRAAAIDVPALVICGAEDRITPPALSEQLAAMIPGSRLEIIPGAGHIANFERPAEFDRIVEDFVAQMENG